MTAPKPLPPFEVVEKLLKYDPETGLLWWLSKPNRNMRDWKTKPAGSMRGGCLYVRIFGQAYLCQRIAWLLHHGKDPGISQIDHIDTSKTNNKINNLRLVTNQQNQFNRGATKLSASGVKGVCWDKKSKKWRAFGRLNGKQNLIGLYQDLAEAKAARMAWEQKTVDALQAS